jgi:hypothetical protein
MVSTGGGNLILYGGVMSVDAAQEPLGDTWEFDAKHWTQLQDIGPGPLQGAAMAFDSGRSRIVLSGGLAVAVGNQDQASPIPLQGFTWEAPVETSVAPPASIAVASLSIPGSAAGVGGATPLPLTITLTGSGNAPTEVSFDGPIFAPNGANLEPVMIPAGTTTFVVQVAFAPQSGPKTFSAFVVGTPAVSLTVLVRG